MKLLNEIFKGFRWIALAFPVETQVSVMMPAQIDVLYRLYDGYWFHNDLLGRGLKLSEQHFRDVSEKIESIVNFYQENNSSVLFLLDSRTPRSG